MNLHLMGDIYRHPKTTTPRMGNNRSRAIAVACFVVTTLLAGCAAGRHFGEGQRLLGEGQQEKGLNELREALRLEPTNGQYRLELINQQTKYLDSLIAQGDVKKAAGKLDEAIDAYTYVVRVDPQNEKARRKLVQALSERNATDLTDQAQKLFAAKNLEGAKEKVKLAITEDANYAPATSLQKKLDALDDDARDARVKQSNIQSVMRKPISLQFRDANLRMVFEAMSRSVGLNVILDRDVRSDLKTTIYVKDASVEDTVDLILLQNQLDKRVLNGNTLFIYPATAAKQKEYQELKVRVFQLSNVDSKYMQNVLKTILKIKDVVIDEKTNNLVIRDTPDAVAVAEKLVAAHDVADAEVMLEVEVLEVSRDQLTNIGIKWPDGIGISTPKGTGPSGELTYAELKALTKDALLVSPALGLGVNLKLTESNANILASPRIRARHKEKARILIGDRVPFVSGSSTVATGANPIVSNSVQYLDVGIKLEVEPYVYSENDVGIKINMEVSNVAKEIPNKNTGDILYQIGTRSASTSLRLKDGETQVLAGLISDQERGSAAKVPGLGQTPLLGRLFSNDNGNSSKTEIVLSITPRIIRNQSATAARLRDIWSGTDGQIREFPLRLDPIGIVRSSSTGDAPTGGSRVGERPAGGAGASAAPSAPAAPANSSGPANAPGATGLPSGTGNQSTTPPGTSTTPTPAPVPTPRPNARPESARPGGIFSPSTEITPAPPPTTLPPKPRGAEQVQQTAPDLSPVAMETPSDPKPVAGAPNLAAPLAATGVPAKSISSTQSAISGNLDAAPLSIGGSSSQFVWSGPAQTKAGSAFQASLSSSLSQPLGLIPIVLRYDPMALTFKAVSPGEIATRAGIDQISSKVDDVTGKIELTLQSKANKLSGQGSLVNVTFEAKGYKSTTTLTASQVDIKQPDGSVRSIRPPKPYTMRITQ
jgi:general secretion pathway protein D